MRILHFTFLFLLGLHFAVSQDCLWASQAGGTLYETVISDVVDRNGNTYIGGIYRSNPFLTNSASFTCLGINDLFLIKYEPSGNEVWTMRFGGPNEFFYESLGSMALDTLHSRLLVTGSFNAMLALPDTVLTGSGLTVFLLVMDLEKNILWARAAGGNGEDQGLGIAYDDQGNVYISGINQEEATFQQTTIPRGGFLAKYSLNGDLLWAKNKFRFADYNYSEADPFNLCFANNSLYVNGDVVKETIIIDTITLILPDGNGAGYIASFSREGNIEWLRAFGYPDGSSGRKIAIDQIGNIYMAGTMWGPMGIFNDDTLSGVSGGCFLVKYSKQGDYQWVQGIQPSGFAKGFGVEADNEENVYFTGLFMGYAHFGQFVLFSDASSIDTMDIFLARYSKEGGCIGVKHYSRGRFSTVAVDHTGNVYLGGSFLNSINIGPQPMISRGGYDAFIAKCSPITGIEYPGEYKQTALLIYANPNTGQCRVTVPEEFRREKELALYIYDHTGRLIQEARLHLAGETVEIDIRARAKGLYHAILSNGGKSYPGKIVFE